MAQSPSPSSVGAANVHGWLMNVPGYRQDSVQSDPLTDRQVLNSLTSLSSLNPTSPSLLPSLNSMSGRRRASTVSDASEDSINLEDLIKANFTADMDDETDLSNLADLDLDDSTEDFWKMNLHSALEEMEEKHGLFAELQCVNDSHALTSSQGILLGKGLEHYQKEQSSSSMSSEASLNSQFTTTPPYSRYGMMAAPVFPSESTSSSRSLSRLSNYSASSSQASSTAASAIPRPGSVNKLPMSSRSKESAVLPRGGGNTTSTTTTTTRLQTMTQRSALSARASHIPSRTSSASGVLTATATTTTASGTALRTRTHHERASHIPTVRSSTPSHGRFSMLSLGKHPEDPLKTTFKTLKTPITEKKSSGLRPPSGILRSRIARV
ncbi:hypothetical protein BDF14DRAFT_1877362 [Spinellus fusiger]|nr:hypothetical protein BDF14DRAFT_1877362 [Spinellus fusiger]